MANIIGISAHYHDAACCLLRDGELAWAAEEERFSRAKHDPRLPWRAFRACLADCGLRIDQVDAIAYYESAPKKLARQIWMALRAPEMRGQLLARLPDHVGRVEREIRWGLGFDGPLETFDHHLSHTASAFFYSGFDEAAILTVDGVGEWAWAPPPSPT